MAILVFKQRRNCIRLKFRQSTFKVITQLTVFLQHLVHIFIIGMSLYYSNDFLIFVMPVHIAAPGR